MDEADDDETLAAGEFDEWMTEIRGAIGGDNDARVPCGTCVGCCSSSQFVHIGPDETDALAHIPAELLFPAPRAPRGHVLMGYDEHGRCPMLRSDGCGIYEHRPVTCRTYDCRVFAASGLDPADDDSKALISARARRWRFDHDDNTASLLHDAVRAAAQWMLRHGDDLPAEMIPRTTTQTAVVAVLAADVFLPGAGAAIVPTGDVSAEAVRLEITRRRPLASRTSAR